MRQIEMRQRDEEGRIDFSALDPTLDEETLARRVGDILKQAGSMLAARRAAATPVLATSGHAATAGLAATSGPAGTMAEVATWWRPLAAAAVVATIAAGGLLSRIDEAGSPGESSGLAEAMGVPDALAVWVESDQPPATEDLLEMF